MLAVVFDSRSRWKNLSVVILEITEETTGESRHHQINLSKNDQVKRPHPLKLLQFKQEEEVYVHMEGSRERSREKYRSHNNRAVYNIRTKSHSQTDGTEVVRVSKSYERGVRSVGNILPWQPSFGCRVASVTGSYAQLSYGNVLGVYKVSILVFCILTCL